jgi:hypothetical protein
VEHEISGRHFLKANLPRCVERAALIAAIVEASARSAAVVVAAAEALAVAAQEF